jgi:5-methyltetrahydrofolate--homocysteine methyltransferase
MTANPLPERALTLIGERINPGFKSSKDLFEQSDIPGIQRLALRQAEAGASYLNVNIGSRMLEDSGFTRDVVRAIQEVVTLPLSFDFPNLSVQRVCLETYDPSKAQGRKPIVNSIAETRLAMMPALAIQPCKLILMVSERLEGEDAVANRVASEVHAVTRRLAAKVFSQTGLSTDDLIVDVSISMIASDRNGGTRMALGAVKLIADDPDLAGVHIMGGISNIGMGLPAKAVDGTPLKNAVERAFLTLARPAGLDTILATPWENYDPLPDDHFVLGVFREFLAADGIQALKAVRKLYRR